MSEEVMEGKSVLEIFEDSVVPQLGGTWYNDA
jgi:hypothetical protein